MVLRLSKWNLTIEVGMLHCRLLGCTLSQCHVLTCVSGISFLLNQSQASTAMPSCNANAFDCRRYRRGRVRLASPPYNGHYSVISTTSFVQHTPPLKISSPSVIASRLFPTIVGSGLGRIQLAANASLSQVPIQYRNYASLISSLAIEGRTKMTLTLAETTAS